ncbi:hypothetical protein QNM96_13610 [Halostagnicola sp. A-GB9-2]|nr:hypothetical protein [Halostagnicola sp. A-GB9-2]MDJ1433089.1 hypothetical protein [Halostagnicola sp. A-GB9-2]
MGGEQGDTMGLDELEAFLRKKGAAELITEIGTGTATFNALVDAVSISGSTVSTRLSEGVGNDVFTVSHRPTEHGTEKRYALTILGRRIYDWAVQTEFERKVRELRRIRQERETAFEQLVGKINRDMEIRKMVSDSDLIQDQDIDLPEGTSFVPKTPSGEELRKAKYERMEANLKPVEEIEQNDKERRSSK